jgi:catalase-peroxidase
MNGTDEESRGWESVEPKDASAAGTVPDAHDPSTRHAPIMFTTDLALKMDPSYAKISKRFTRTRRSSPMRCQGVVQADAPRHGALSRYLGPAGSAEPQLWQDRFRQWIMN